jgi:aspartyl-tRNA(Asn)/glutamyl-tRNA(Gln) amidotransferase subunit C
MKITEADVEKVAALANLELKPEEKAEMPAQLTRILDYVEQLNALDLSGVEPTAQIVTNEKSVVREDRVVLRTGSSEAGKTVKFFKVPKVITER